ncbi:MAG: integrin alpha, partial [Pseudomonadota bacterium]
MGPDAAISPQNRGSKPCIAGRGQPRRRVAWSMTVTFRITRPVVSRDVEERKLAGDRARDFTTAVKDLNGDGFDDVLVVGMNGSPRNGREKQQGFIFLNDKRG